MTITLNIPDLLAATIARSRPALDRAIIEGFAVESYREGLLSTAEIRGLLGHESRWETEEFLAAHDAWPAPGEAEIIAGAQALKIARQA